MSIEELLRELHNRFTAAGIATPTADAELLVGHILGERRGRVRALAILGSSVTELNRARILDLAEQRCDRIPLQHLTGTAPFRGIDLAVGPGVFIPRPETETVAQYGIDAIADLAEPLVMDLCTGSGALALALATELPKATVWAWEKSAEAHAWAQRNVARHGDNRVHLTHADISELITLESGPLTRVPAVASLDLVISNPPYVPTGMVPKDPEVCDHDPELALYSGSDGLDLIRSISKIGLRYVKPGGSIVLEHAELQGQAIRTLLENDGWITTVTHQDLTARDRCTTAISPTPTQEG